MKKFAPWIFVAIVYAIAVYVVNAKAAEPPIKVPPAWTAPQEQASALAIPQTQPAPPRSVIAVTRCNAIIAVTVVDTDGNLHPIQLEGSQSRAGRGHLTGRAG